MFKVTDTRFITLPAAPISDLVLMILAELANMSVVLQQQFVIQQTAKLHADITDTVVDMSPTAEPAKISALSYAIRKSELIKQYKSKPDISEEIKTHADTIKKKVPAVKPAKTSALSKAVRKSKLTKYKSKPDISAEIKTYADTLKQKVPTADKDKCMLSKQILDNYIAACKLTIPKSYVITAQTVLYLISVGVPVKRITTFLESARPGQIVRKYAKLTAEERLNKLYDIYAQHNIYAVRIYEIHTALNKLIESKYTS
jgi:hypothetical protein